MFCMVVTEISWFIQMVRITSTRLSAPLGAQLPNTSSEAFQICAGVVRSVHGCVCFCGVPVILEAFGAPFSRLRIKMGTIFVSTGLVHLIWI